MRQMAKSTPRSERRSVAEEAFCAAVRDYHAGCGDLETYLAHQIHCKLVQENKQYTVTYRQKSLDQSLVGEEGNNFCLYDTVDMANAGGIDAVEEKIMAEEFQRSLSTSEQTMLQMLQDGNCIPKIAEEMQITEQELLQMGQEIRQKRLKFYRDAS